jgi:Carboxypeptidase regulatory-like domain
MKALLVAPFALLMVIETVLSIQTTGISIQGIVLRAGSREPVSKAYVELSSAGGNSRTFAATTSEDGRFVVRSAPPGRYELIVRRMGYITAKYGQRRANGPGELITLENGRPVQDLTIVMTPTAAISGRIYDGFGEPVNGAKVRAMQSFYLQGRRILTEIQSTVTDDLGEYRLFWLPPGRYFVSATGPDPATDMDIVVNDARGDIFYSSSNLLRTSLSTKYPDPLALIPQPRVAPQESEVYAPVYFPTTTDRRSALPIDLEAGAEFSGVDITVRRLKTHHIRGTIVDAATGEVLREQHTEILRSNNPPTYRVDETLPVSSDNFPVHGFLDRRTGVFEMHDVVPGSYFLIAWSGKRFGRVAVEVRDGDLENVVVSVAEGFNLRGRVAIEGRTLATAEPLLAKLKIELILDPYIPAGGFVSASPAPDGSFTLESVVSGDYRVGVEPILNVDGNASVGQTALYIKSIRQGNNDVLNGGLHLTRQPSEPLEIVVGTNPASLNGSVVDEKQQPVPNVLVLLAPDVAYRNRTDLFQEVITDTSGRFQIEFVPPGDYKLFAWKNIEDDAWQDSDFMQTNENRGKPIRVTEGSKQDVPLVLIATPDLTHER